jgi:hypothetical protein
MDTEFITKYINFILFLYIIYQKEIQSLSHVRFYPSEARERASFYIKN